MPAKTDSCPGCGKDKDKRAAFCRSCRPGRPATDRPTGRKIQFWLSAEQASLLEQLGGDAWAKQQILDALAIVAFRRNHGEKLEFMPLGNPPT